MLQHVEMGLPGLCENVPMATGTKQERTTNLPLMSPARCAVYQQQQMQTKVQVAKARRMRVALAN